jgi:hypothetical protein
MPIVLGIVVVLAFIGAGVLFLAPESNEESAQDTQTEEAARIDSQEESQEVDGTELDVDVEVETEAEVSATGQSYSASAEYLTPARTPLEVTVNMTVAADGTVTESDVVYDNGAGYSNAHQERFDKAYASEVIGENISDINLSRVGGASLTTEAFNEAVAEIAAQV